MALPKSVQDLLAILASQPSKVAAVAESTGRAHDITESDVANATALATVAATMLPQAPKQTEQEKAIAVAVARCTSIALGIGDHAAIRAPSTPALYGYKLLTKKSANEKRELILAALNELASAVGAETLARNLDATACGTGRGGFVRGKTKAPKPAAKAWRLLTGSAVSAGILTAVDASALCKALVPAQKRAAA